MAIKPRNAIPTVTSKLAPDVRRFVDRVRDVIGEGTLDYDVTEKDVVDVLPFDVEDDGTITIPDYRLKECPIVPPKPPSQFASGTPFEAQGIFENVILKWGGLPYGATRCHDYTEIWRSTVAETNNPDVGAFSEAILIGTATGRVYVDPVGASAKAWYWIRFVDYRGEVSEYQDPAGLLAETAQDLDYILGVLTEDYGLSTAHPFFFVPDCELLYNQWLASGGQGLPPECEPVVIGADESGEGGTTLEPGVYINTAFIGDATILDAKIRDLAAEKLFAVEGTIANAIIDRGHINNLMIDNIIASNDYYSFDDDGNVVGTNADLATWLIDKNGDAKFRGIRIVDNDGNTILSSGGIDGPFADPSNIAGFGNFSTLDQVTLSNISTYIEAGAISDLYIGRFIQSADWRDIGDPLGPQGFSIDRGNPEAGVNSRLVIADGDFYGTLNVGTFSNVDDTPTGTQITNDVIRVVVDGQERVRIGKLT